ncbi:class I SAM-dependent methyltransferase [Luethyella okanaganae]|uniref:Class I SAM-dependent methyltransferase n=1 Tax=Luethyella okanaganae TaxID=69372 RepID=A0ABW1VH43_9MICO
MNALSVLASLRERDADATELMDDPDCDPATLARTYAQFRLVNAAVSGWRSSYRRFIRPQLSNTVPTTLLDIGSGGGDLPRALAAWAARDGLRLEITAIDPDARAHGYATSLPLIPRVDFRRAFSAELVAAGERFDLVTSNHLLHHLMPHEFGALLRDSEQLIADTGARRSHLPRVLHGDITRGAIAYLGFWIATLPFFHGSFIRADGLTSIRRSYTAEELRTVAPDKWRVVPQGPFRQLLIWPANGRSASQGSAGPRPTTARSRGEHDA